MTAKPRKDEAKSAKPRTDIFDDETGAYVGHEGEKATSTKDIKTATTKQQLAEGS